jgi:hypothetical protein
MQWEIPNLRQRKGQHGGDRHAQAETQLRSVSAGLCAEPVQSGSDSHSIFQKSIAGFSEAPVGNGLDSCA